MLPIYPSGGRGHMVSSNPAHVSVLGTTVSDMSEVYSGFLRHYKLTT